MTGKRRSGYAVNGGVVYGCTGGFIPREAPDQSADWVRFPAPLPSEAPVFGAERPRGDTLRSPGLVSVNC